ncbi:hypothetical protein [Metabacillus sp. Hm71]|uniref:hypothetical protein n=1 Tax=Metabacillus sp. Hm71 TaxID=3450743 RepID=UPI003F43DF58
MSVEVKVPVFDERDLSLVYSPGVAEPCKAISENADQINDYTIKGNLVGSLFNLMSLQKIMSFRTFFDKRVVESVSIAVAKTAIKSGAIRKKLIV